MPRTTWTCCALSLLLAVSSSHAVGAPTDPAPADGGRAGLAPEVCTTITDAEGAPTNVIFRGRPESTDSGADFTVVVVPDTQFLTERAGDVFERQMRWVVANRAARNIVFVTHVGDIVDDGEFQEQWDNANAALSLLEDPLTTGLPHGIPYGLAIGNHDQYPADSTRLPDDEGGTTELYEAMFGRHRFEGRSYYGGHFDFGDAERYADNMDNHYELFGASGMDFLVLHMEYEERDTATRRSVLAWGDGVLKAYPERRAIVTVHYLIDPGPPDGCEWSTHGAAVYEQFKDDANVFLMLSGHVDLAGRRTDTSGDHAIHTVLQDYQSHGSERDGWLRVYTFSPKDDEIRIETLGTEDLAHLSEDDHEFTLPYDMEGGLPWEEIGTFADVASGERVCARWPGRAHGVTYQWRVTLSNGTAERTGPTWTFTAEYTDGDCDDGNPCTIDGWDGAACAHSSGSDPCDDGDPCTVGDRCAHDACVGTARDCDDGNACTADACEAGECLHAYAPVAGCCTTATDCDDGDAGTEDRCARLGTCRNTPPDADGGDTGGGRVDAGGVREDTGGGREDAGVGREDAGGGREDAGRPTPSDGGGDGPDPGDRSSSGAGCVVVAAPASPWLLLLLPGAAFATRRRNGRRPRRRATAV